MEVVPLQMEPVVANLQIVATFVLQLHINLKVAVISWVVNLGLFLNILSFTAVVTEVLLDFLAGSAFLGGII